MSDSKVGTSEDQTEVFTSKNGFVTSRAQSKRMSAVKGKNTRAERALRQALWHSGLRYRKNVSNLPGRPDIAFPSQKLAVFVDGEFWHGKDWPQRKQRLKRNRDYWVAKIERNIQRDREHSLALQERGWRVLRLWSKTVLADPVACASEVAVMLAAVPVDPIGVAAAVDGGALVQQPGEERQRR